MLHVACISGCRVALRHCPLASYLQVLVSIRMSVKNKSFPEQLAFDQVKVAATLGDLSLPDDFGAANHLLFTPCDNATGSDPGWRLAQSVTATFGGVPVCLPCNSGCNNSVDAYYAAHQFQVVAAVVVTSNTSTLVTPGSTVQYYIRMDGDAFLPGITGASYMPSYHTMPDPTSTAYNDYFLPLQAAVERAILGLRGVAGFFSLSVQQFPATPYEQNTATAVLGNVLPVYLLLIFSIQIR
jgi:hypothetical protein